jgi:hypothetical protein
LDRASCRLPIGAARSIIQSAEMKGGLPCCSTCSSCSPLLPPPFRDRW